jgi:predicted DCC family thiol-disulfide oxidoreductase YuxK
MDNGTLIQSIAPFRYTAWPVMNDNNSVVSALIQNLESMLKSWSKENKLVLVTSLISFCCLTAGTLVYLIFGHQLIEAMYKGESVGFLNKLIERHRIGRPWGTLDHYLTLGRLLFSRIVIFFIAISLFAIAFIKFRRIRCMFSEFFSAATHPINLAVFRVVLFYSIFCAVDPSSVIWFSQIPRELQIAPVGTKWLIDYIPINATWATFASSLLLISSSTGMIGLFSRTSALVTVILSFYVLGIPQFYGKVNHYHHLLWFAAILAASPCGDALSCDAILAAWKRADHGLTEPPGPSRVYALPLRFVWLLMGVIYFFAGFRKVWDNGGDWALSDNLKFIMYAKWLDLGGWTPVFRIDQYPFLYKLAAVGTIFFEMSFIFLIFSKKVRLLAPISGIFFHTMIDFFMRISFKSILRCYVAFFDWHAIFRRVGYGLYREQMYVLYDGNCKLCRRTIASLRLFDIFERVTYVNALDNEALIASRLGWLDSTALMRDMHVVVEGKRWAGFPAYRVLAARIPLLWPAVPFLYLWPIPIFANRIYRHVADSRVCNIPGEPLKAGRATATSAAVSNGVVATVGVLLLLGNFLFSVGNIGYSWPLAAYPTFAGMAGPEANSLEITARNSTGEIVALTPQTLGPELAPERFWGLMSVVLSPIDVQERRARLKAIWQLWARHDSRLQQVASIQLYSVTLSTLPERQRDNPLHKELLFQVNF